MRTATAPPSRPGRGRMNPAELEEKVLELERYKRDEEQERLREQAKKKREFLGARRKLQAEIKKTTQEVRARAAEVEAIERSVLKVQEHEERSIERQTHQNLRFQARVTDLESRTAEKAQFLQERMTELGLARGRLAHLQFALRSLDDNLIIPVETSDSQAVAGEGGGIAAPAAPKPPRLRGAELTAALRIEAEELRAEARRLERENGMLHEELKEVRRVFDVGPDDLKASKDAGLYTAASGIDTEASRAEPAPEPPASLSRASTTEPSMKHMAVTAATIACEPVHLRAGTGPSLTSSPAPALARSWSPVSGTAWPGQGMQLLDSTASTSRLTTAAPSSRISFGAVTPSVLPAQMPGAVNVAATYPMPGNASQSAGMFPWTWPAGGLPVVA